MSGMPRPPPPPADVDAFPVRRAMSYVLTRTVLDVVGGRAGEILYPRSDAVMLGAAVSNPDRVLHQQTAESAIKCTPDETADITNAPDIDVLDISVNTAP